MICAEKSEQWDRSVREYIYQKTQYPAFRWLWRHLLLTSLIGAALAVLLILMIVVVVKAIAALEASSP